VNLDNKADTCKCRNPDSNYWDATAVTCMPKLTNRQPCQSVAECLSYKGLDCTGSCACSLPDQFFWNSTADQCTPRQSSGGPCQSAGQCLPGKGLECFDTNEDAQIDSCRCPDPTNQYWDASLNRCNCLNLAAFYWDPTTYKCMARQSNGGPCQSVGQCLPSKGLDCLDTNGHIQVDSCVCLNLAAFYCDEVSTKSCVAKKLYGASCSATLECQTNYYLNCIDSICQTVPPGYKTTDNIYIGKNSFVSFRILSFD